MRVLAACVAVASLCAACQIDEGPPPLAELGTFPYHPVVFELDLAIYAYQLTVASANTTHITAGRATDIPRFQRYHG
jgi:hypothetical protein